MAVRTPVSADLNLEELEIAVSPEEIARRKQWLQFADDDVTRRADGVVKGGHDIADLRLGKNGVHIRPRRVLRGEW